MRGVLLAGLSAAALMGTSDAFSVGAQPAIGLRAAQKANVCKVDMRGSDGASQQPRPAALAKAASSVLGGVVAASLLFSPAIDVFSGPGQLSDGGVANAQGATSRKSTRGSPSKDANKDPESILRLTLPINEKNPIREAQVSRIPLGPS